MVFSIKPGWTDQHMMLDDDGGQMLLYDIRCHA